MKTKVQHGFGALLTLLTLTPLFGGVSACGGWGVQPPESSLKPGAQCLPEQGTLPELEVWISGEAERGALPEHMRQRLVRDDGLNALLNSIFRILAALDDDARGVVNELLHPIDEAIEEDVDSNSASNDNGSEDSGILEFILGAFDYLSGADDGVSKPEILIALREVMTVRGQTCDSTEYLALVQGLLSLRMNDPVTGENRLWGDVLVDALSGLSEHPGLTSALESLSLNDTSSVDDTNVQSAEPLLGADAVAFIFEWLLKQVKNPNFDAVGVRNTMDDLVLQVFPGNGELQGLVFELLDIFDHLIENEQTWPHIVHLGTCLVDRDASDAIAISAFEILTLTTNNAAESDAPQTPGEGSSSTEQNASTLVHDLNTKYGLLIEKLLGALINDRAGTLRSAAVLGDMLVFDDPNDLYGILRSFLDSDVIPALGQLIGDFEDGCSSVDF